MIKIECSSLEEVYQEACDRLECSITDIHIDIVQYPRNIFGIIKKNAIVIAYKKKTTDNNDLTEEHPVVKTKEPDISKKDTIIDISKPVEKYNDTVLDSFYSSPKTAPLKNNINTTKDETILEIREIIQDVFLVECLNCTLEKVEFYDEKTIYIKFDGEDISLMIGKNGHRYKALSYLIFSWIFSKYNLFVKVEMGQFLSNQNKMIKRHLRAFCEEVKSFGRGNTDSLDGVLLHLGVEYLREQFPDKMVIVKINKDLSRYIKVSDFRK